MEEFWPTFLFRLVFFFFVPLMVEVVGVGSLSAFSDRDQNE